MFRVARFQVGVPGSVLGSVLSICVCFVAVAHAQVNMPDPSQIAGRALPAPELADGTVSVRLVRESIGNNITGHEVTVTAGAVKRTGTTDDTGRAQITGLDPGASAIAEAVVDGEKLVSQPFEVPAKGGIRVILISGLEAARARREKEEAEAAKAPPVKGTVVLGGDSRIVFEFQNDSLNAFYLLEIVNTARARVDTGGSLIIDLPTGAAGARLMEGSFPGATVRGDRLTIAGPFPSGTTSVQVGFSLIHSGGDHTIVQKFPVTLQRISVASQKVGEVHMTSPQFTNHGDVNAGDGTPFILGTGGALPAGSELQIKFANLPHQATWPRNVALALAGLIFAIGGWLAFAGSGREDKQRQLIARRDSLLGELVKLEEQHRGGRVDDSKYQSRKRHLMAELERIYGELDHRPEAA
jgi:hypothetical protein